MRIELAQFLVKAAEHHDPDTEVKLYENYSGRGMFGDTTTGVVCPSETDLLIYVMKYLAYDNSQVTEMELEAIEMLTDFSVDSLGLDTIVY